MSCVGLDSRKISTQFAIDRYACWVGLIFNFLTIQRDLTLHWVCRLTNIIFKKKHNFYEKQYYYKLMNSERKCLHIKKVKK